MRRNPHSQETDLVWRARGDTSYTIWGRHCPGEPFTKIGSCPNENYANGVIDFFKKNPEHLRIVVEHQKLRDEQVTCLEAAHAA